MKHSYLILGICLGCLFTACKPDFDLNAPNKDITVVYGILCHQDHIHYVKIYKGFQSHETGGVYIGAQNPDSIYYNVNDIDVVLQEYYNGKPTSRPNIPLYYTHDFPREEGPFYYGEAKTLYYTTEDIKQGCSYKIVITNKKTGKITEGMAAIVGDFEITKPAQNINMNRDDMLEFTKAPAASDSCYEFHISFLYFEVDKETKEVTTGKITKVLTSVGETYFHDELIFQKKISATYYTDIAQALKPNPKVVRYMGKPTPSLMDGYVCIEIEGWAAGSSMKNYIMSNKPTSSFVQVNKIYTNMSVSEGDGSAFGFFSSKVKCFTREYTTYNSEDSLLYGSKTRNLGFRPRAEYKP